MESSDWHWSPFSQQSAAELQVCPGAGQQRSGPTLAFPPQVSPVKLVLSIHWQSLLVRHVPYGGAYRQKWLLGSQLPEQQSESDWQVPVWRQHLPALHPDESVQSASAWQAPPGGLRQVALLEQTRPSQQWLS
jgi:hypothetical protein